MFVSLLDGAYYAQGYVPAQGMLFIIVAAVTGTFVASAPRCCLKPPECNTLNAAMLECTQMLECKQRRY